MELFDAVLRELLSKKMAEINKSDVSELSKYTVRVLRWCLDQDFLDICNSYIDLISKFLESLTPLRVSKYFNYGSSGKSFDDDLLSVFKKVITRYYYLALFANVDEELRVPVKVLKKFKLNNIEFFENSHFLMNLSKAVLYEALGFCKILDVDIKSLISSLEKAKKGTYKE